MIVSIASQKGGVGKSVSSLTLAQGLAKLKKKKVLLVDVDAQANSSKVLLPNYNLLTKEETIYRTILKRQSIPVYKTTLPGLFCSPSHILMSDTDMELATAIDHREARLKNELDKIKKDYDYVILDCPPALGWLTTNAFTASDRVIVVVSPGYFELDSIVQISKTIEKVKELFNPDLKLWGFLYTMHDPTINSKTSLQILRQTYTGLVFKSVVPRNTDIRDSIFSKTDIFSFNPSSTSAHAYKNLIDELFI